jgi:N-acetylneuraminic acid mutarotase
MFRLKISVIVKLMFLTIPAVAQKNPNLLLKWKIVGELPADSGQQISLGVAGPVTGYHKNVLFIAGGANFPAGMPWEGGVKKFYTTVNVYFKKRHKLKLSSQSFSLPYSIAYVASCSTPFGVLYAGGESENGISDKVWLMIWDDRAGEILFKSLPVLPVAVSNASAILNGTTVFIAGGETAAHTTSQLLALDLVNIQAGWNKLADIPQPVSHTVVTAIPGKTGDKIFLCGGRKKNNSGISDFYNSVFVYDVITNTWEEKKALPYALSAGTGIVCDAENILLFGGDKGIVFHKTETLIAAINAEKDPVKKQELIQEKNKLQSEHPGFSNEVLIYNIENDAWNIAGTIPFDTPVTTTAVQWKSGIIIPSGEIKAGVRSPNILGVKILQKNK